MNNVSARFSLSMVVKGDNSDVADLGIATATISETITAVMTDGTGAGKANKFYADTGSVAGGGETDIDLQTALDAVGVALALDILKALYIKNDSDANFAIGWLAGGTVGNALSLFTDPDTETFLMPPGGIFFWADPTAGIVVDATHKVLRINADGAAAKAFDIIVVGEET